MTKLTEKQFIASARTLAAVVLETAAQKHLSPDDTANIAGAALAEVLGQQLGPVGAVERLRDIADQLEAQFLN